jgi:hypothetical protein
MMSTLEATPVKTKTLNSKMLTIAAVLLIVLALLFLATPLLRLNGAGARGNFNRTFTGQNGQGLPGTGNGRTFTFPGGQGGTNVFPGTGNGSQGQGGTTLPNRQFGSRNSLLRIGLFSGIAGTVVYGIALLLALAAAIGMLSAKMWGKVLGIIMAVVYLLLGLFSFLPALLLSRFIGTSNPLTLVLNSLHIVLAIAVIVFASIPAKKNAEIAEPLPPTLTA